MISAAIPSIPSNLTGDALTAAINATIRCINLALAGSSGTPASAAAAAAVVAAAVSSPTAFFVQHVNIAGAPYLVHASVAAADGIVLGVIVVQDPVGYAVTWGSEFAGVTATTVPQDPNTTNPYLFIGRSSDARFISATLSPAGMLL